MRVVIVPIRAFQGAKLRLAAVLDQAARAELVRDLAGGVIAAAAPLPVAVACEDDEVARFAAEHGAAVVRVPPGGGLSAAVQAAVEHLAGDGFEVVTVAHGDLALASDLSTTGRDAASGGGREVVIAPDRRLDGTNVISVPARSGFRFAYGPGSFGRHRAEAARLGLDCRLLYDWSLALDVDFPDDLDVLAGCDRAVPQPVGR